MKNIYVCGPTVYSQVHIGNIRPILTFDIYIRALQALGEKVNFIHNITDIDDKIIKRASEEKVSEQTLSLKYEMHYRVILKLLNIETPTHMPRVMEAMKDIIAFIEKLIKTKHAYVADGNVYFDTTSIASYGSVSHQQVDHMVFEETSLGKKHPADFTLWKKTNIGIQFDSPWSQGRPGWHTECVVFVDKYNHGQQLDIHGGGIDLIFPHHENENAQFQAAHNLNITKEWKHVGHINLDGMKMSKSLGNIIDAETFIKKYGTDTLRMIFLTSNVTGPLDMTTAVIDSAIEQVAKMRKAFLQAQVITQEYHDGDVKVVAEELSAWKFASAMKHINQIIKDFNKDANRATAVNVMALMNLLGFNFANEKLTSETLELFKNWESLRASGDFAAADKIRAKLMKLGLV